MLLNSDLGCQFRKCFFYWEGKYFNWERRTHLREEILIFSQLLKWQKFTKINLTKFSSSQGGKSIKEERILHRNHRLGRRGSLTLVSFEAIQGPYSVYIFSVANQIFSWRQYWSIDPSKIRATVIFSVEDVKEMISENVFHSSVTWTASNFSFIKETSSIDPVNWFFINNHRERQKIDNNNIDRSNKFFMFFCYPQFSAICALILEMKYVWVIYHLIQ